VTNKANRQFTLLLDELERWNRRVNLTAVRDRAQMEVLHILDSLAARPLLEGRQVLDVGTGPGFPGLPLAIVEPDREFTLLDSNNKKIRFVEIARALASLPKLVEIAGHHVREDGVFVALKGRYPAGEIEELPVPWSHEAIELDVPGLEKGSRHAVLLRRAV
jgi:16S rRNA (guanine527-N7)-methyltransferase